MRRKLFTFAAVLSSLLCVAACVLWVRSYTVEDALLWQRVDGARWARSVSGRLLLAAELADWSHADANYYGIKYRSASPEPVDADASLYLLSVGPRDIWVHRQWGSFKWTRWVGSGASKTQL